jgi:hypothetical protein
MYSTAVPTAGTRGRRSHIAAAATSTPDIRCTSTEAVAQKCLDTRELTPIVWMLLLVDSQPETQSRHDFSSTAAVLLA